MPPKNPGSCGLPGHLDGYDPNPVFDFTKNHKFGGCNRVFETFTGRNKRDLAGKSVYDIFHRPLADHLDGITREISSASATKHYETSLQNAQGQTKEVLLYLTPYRDTNGQVQGPVATMLDITQQSDSCRWG